MYEWTSQWKSEWLSQRKSEHIPKTKCRAYQISDGICQFSTFFYFKRNLLSYSWMQERDSTYQIWFFGTLYFYVSYSSYPYQFLRVLKFKPQLYVSQLKQNYQIKFDIPCKYIHKIKSKRRWTWTGEYDQNKYFRSSSMGNVCWCEFFGYVQIFRWYSFSHLELVKWLFLVWLFDLQTVGCPWLECAQDFRGGIHQTILGGGETGFKYVQN